MKNSLKILSITMTLMFISILLQGCAGRNPKDERRDAILRANQLLNVGDCTGAIYTLEVIGREYTDADYLQTLASAYACKAGFREPSFFSNDLSKVATPAPMGGFTLFDLSDEMDSPINSKFENMQTAIDLLLYAGGFSRSYEPTSEKRSEFFSSSDLGNIDAQLLYMVMVQLGMYMYYYGNSSSTGVKGSGTGTNECFVNYTGNINLENGPPNRLSNYLSGGLTGACDNTGEGHADLGAEGDLNVSRLCQGVVLLNAFFDIFPSLIANVAGDDFDELEEIEEPINLARQAVLLVKSDAAMSDLLNTISQTNCESDHEADTQYLQVYFAFMFEVLFQ